MFILATLIILLNLIICCGHAWLIENVGLISIDEVVFHLKMPLAGTSSSMLSSIITGIVVVPLLITFISAFIMYHAHAGLKVRAFKWEHTFDLKKTIPRLVVLLGLIIGYNQLVYFNEDYDITGYIEAQNYNSTFIAEHYVDPKKVDITFPEEKRNLIYIYLESGETTFLSEENGGHQKNSLMPELEQLALENTNFSNTDKLGGAEQISNLSWTMAAIISQTAGLPLKLPPVIINDEMIDTSNYGTNTDNIMSGAYTLNNILKKEGYRQVFMAGSDMTFGGRRVYLQNHGNVEIKDIYTAEEEGIIEKDYRVFWGFEDGRLFDYAKKTLTELSAGSQPFAFNVLTVNTHFPDGYLEEDCVSNTGNPYADSLVCSSTQVMDFVNWIKKQDFYENTTVIVIGDHLTMANNEILEGTTAQISADDDETKNLYLRTVYNTIINSAVEDPSEELTKNRTFTTNDFFPTTLAAIGATIPGDRLGLGTNLYSGKKTLAEEYGIETLDREYAAYSSFYLLNLL